MAEKKARQYQALFENLRAATIVLRKAGELDYMRLSIAAKTYFMLNEKKASATENELEQLATRFGWSVSPRQIREAADYLQRLNLIRPDSVGA